MRIANEHFQLHFIVLLNSFVPMILSEITLDFSFIVFYRMLAAALMLAAFLVYRKDYSFVKGAPEWLPLLGTGLLTSAYWSLLVLSTQRGGVSVALVGMATSSLWVNLLSPLLLKTRTRPFQHLIALCALLAVYIIFHSGVAYGQGLLLGIGGSFFAALLTLLNSRLSNKYPIPTITFYQMAGGAIGMGFFLLVYTLPMSEGPLHYLPTAKEWLLIVGLAFVYSIWAYNLLIKIMEKISPFVVSLVSNLSPVYGILFAVLLTDETRLMTPGFVVGTALLFASVFAYNGLVYYYNKQQG